MRVVLSRLLRLVGPFVALCVAGGLAGLVAPKMFAQYRSGETVPWGATISDYQDLAPILFAQQSVENYMQGKGLTDDADLRALSLQFAHGRRTPTIVEEAFAITRAELQRVPDQLQQDALKGTRIFTGISVTTFGDTPEEAARRSRTTAQYIADTVLRFSLYNMIHDLNVQSRTARQRTIAARFSTQYDIASLDQKIAAMQQIASRYSDLSNNQDILTLNPATLGSAPQSAPPGPAGSPPGFAASPPGSAPIMPYLSPRRQLVALESERANDAEMLREHELLLARYTADENYTAKVLPLFSRPLTGGKIFDAAEKSLSVYDEGNATPDEAASKNVSRSAVLAKLTGFAALQINDSPYFATPPASLVMPSRTLFLAMGVLIGIAIWFVGFRVSSYLAEQQGKPVRPAVVPQGVSPTHTVRQQIS